MDMDMVSLLVILPLSLLLIYMFRRPAKHSHPLPPSPPGLPIIGHLQHILTDNPSHSLAKLSRKMNAPILHLRLGQIPTTVISNAKYAREVLKTHDLILSNRPQILSAQILSYGCSDVTFSNGAYWRQARRIVVTELLSAKRIASFAPVRHEEVTRMLAHIVAAEGKATNMSDIFISCASDVLCRIAYGRRLEEERSGSSSKQLVDVFQETQELFAGFDVSEFFPSLGWVNWVTGWTQRLKKNLADLSDVCDEIIAEHIKEGPEMRQGKEDFVDVLLRVQKSEDHDVEITDENLKALVLDMYVAGTDTTNAALNWVMTELARHPRVFAKAQAEVRELHGPGALIDEERLHCLPYLKAVIKETLRIHPPVPLLVPREAQEEVIVDGYRIPAKSRILVNGYAIGRDPEVWENADDFVPERFQSGEMELKELKGQTFDMIPFGGGRRGCPGYPFSLATAEIALARMLYHFNWELPPGVKPEDVDVEESFGLSTGKKHPLILVPAVAKGYEPRY